MLAHYLTRHRIGAYLDGALEESEARATARHLAGCGRCQREAERLRRLHALLRDAMPAASAPDWTGFWPGIVRRIERPRRSAPTPAAAARPGLGWRPRLALGGALVALLASLMVWQALWPDFAPEHRVMVRSARTEIPDGGLMVYAPPERDLAVVWILEKQ
ncbi:MAG TPA: zf-HC2 domain-containing protein [Methylomirabilota bacterium]|nr:zf-HC2 domain-containing protein [Methylomirabilota bacterium]